MPRPTPRGPRKTGSRTASPSSRLKPVLKKAGPKKAGLKKPVLNTKRDRPAPGTASRKPAVSRKPTAFGKPAAPRKPTAFGKPAVLRKRNEDRAPVAARGLVKKTDRTQTGESRVRKKIVLGKTTPKRLPAFGKPALRSAKPVRKSIRSNDLVKGDVPKTERVRKSPLSLKLTSPAPRKTTKSIKLGPSKKDQPKHRTPEFLKDKEGPETVRLNKFISNSGVTSRRKADELIVQGAVTINGKVIKELGIQVKPYEDQVAVNGETISMHQRFVYLLLNKPKDTITTTSDEKDRTTVLDYVDTQERVYPIGRLDRHTTGVLLLTNDGELTNRLTHPSFEIEREYHVTLDQPIQISHARQIADGGINIGEGDVTGKAEISIAENDPKDVVLKLREGKNREVRRLFEALGYEVMKLDRVSFAGITHRGMSRGASRPLSPQEVRQLRKMAGINLE